MASEVNRFSELRRMVLGVACALLCGGLLPAAHAGTPAPAATPATSARAPITAITYENHCSGCAHGSTLVLRRDGSATLTASGNARFGTEDSVSRGRVRAADFAELARLALSLGFFQMDEAYQEPGLQDGAWASISLARGEETKQVFRRLDAGPEALKTLEQAIAAVQARIQFTADRR